VSASVNPQPDTRLTGRRLDLARTVWIVVVALAVGLYLLSIPLELAFYQIVCSGADCQFGQASPAGLEQLRQAGLSLGLYAGAFTAFGAFVTLVFLILAVVIFWRKSDDWMAIFASLTLVLLGITNDITALALVGQQYPALQFLSQFVAFLGADCVILFFYLFPNGRFAPRWIVWLVPLWLVKDAVAHFRPDLYPNDWLLPFELASILFAQIYHYWRVSNTVQRQQTKWVVFGSAVGVGGILGLTLLFSILPPAAAPPAGIADLLVFAAFSLFALLIPLSIGMAILRSRLWDIDVLIRRTLVYGALTGLLALAYFGSVLVLESIVRLLTGQNQSQVVTVISTLAIAALFVPLRRRVQAFIDRRFYRRKYDAARTLAQFGASLRDEVNLDNLSAHLLAAVDETMQPESAALWLRATQRQGQSK
jgi:hypothetical protein